MKTGKLVFVSGAGRGIGQAIALRLAEKGYLVSGCLRTLEQLEETKKRSQGKVRIKKVDVSSEDQIKSWLEGEMKDTGFMPWGLVTAAGVYGPIGPFVENSWAEWKNALEINLFGTALLAKHFADTLISSHLPGRLVFMSGGGATQPQPNFSSYGACKAAVVRFAETLSHELKSHRVTVNCIAPGAVNTKFTEDLLKAGEKKVGKETYEKVLKQKQSGGTPPDRAANLCEYLLSDAASLITGRLISAVWDPWPTLDQRATELEKTDIYTLRRIVPEDRNKDWSS